MADDHSDHTPHLPPPGPRDPIEHGTAPYVPPADDAILEEMDRFRELYRDYRTLPEYHALVRRLRRHDEVEELRVQRDLLLAACQLYMIRSPNPLIEDIANVISKAVAAAAATKEEESDK